MFNSQLIYVNYVQIQEKAARDACDPNRYIEKCKPVPDPQVLLNYVDFSDLILFCFRNLS